MRQVLLFFFLLSGVFISSAQQDKEVFLVGDVLSKAGKQRMLTQRMGKCYVGMYLGMEVATNQQEIAKSIALFEKQLQKLLKIKINGHYMQRVRKVERLWTAYKELISTRPTKEKLEQLLIENTVILEACELVVYDLEVYASRFSQQEALHQMNKSIVHLENLAGRQRMLTERILFYFLANQAILEKTSATKAQLKEIIQDYDKTLVTLMGAIENTPEIDYRLTLLSNEWKTIAEFCLTEVEDVTQINSVLNLGKKLLNSMEDVTKLYEELIDLRVASLLLNNAIDMAGEQSILTQKMLKSYLLLGIENDHKHQKDIEKYIQLFEYHIDELKLFAPMDEITTALNIVDNLWTDYRNQILSTSTKLGAAKLLHANNELLRSCDNVVMLIEMYAKIYQKSISRYNSDMARWINQVDHQEMLTERILMYSNALSWGVEGVDLKEKLEQTGYEYIENFNELNQSLLIPEIETRRKALVKNWEVIKTYLNDVEQYQDVLMEWSLTLAKELHALTGLYRERIHKMVTGEAINRANNQCLLSQKIATSYIAIGMGLDLDYYQQQLKKDKLLFQKQLEELKSYVSTPQLKETLGKINQLWNVYQATCRGTLNKDKLPELLDISQEMLGVCEEMVAKINNEKTNNQLNGIDKAARLRTMTEQVLLFELVERWTSENYQKEIGQVLRRFDEHIQLLANQQTNSTRMTTRINVIIRYYKRLDDNCKELKDVDLYSILLLHNMLLLETEKLTNAYEQVMIF